MSTFLDATAVVALHVDGRERPVVRAAVDGVAPACVSALSLTEAVSVIAKLTDEPVLQADLEDAIRLQWDRYAVVPVDARCLSEATALLRNQPLRLADAIQLAAARRLPPPITFVTFDPVQIPVALGIGFDVLSR